MRKTLTAIVIVLAAGSLAACKMFWEKDETPPPAPVPVATTTETPAVTAHAAKPEQTASTDKPATPEVAPAAPASK